MSSPKRQPGGQPGNQSARTTGWFSTHQPATTDQLRSAAKTAIRQRDPKTLRTIARAFAVRGDKRTARHLRQLALQLSIGRDLAYAGDSHPGASDQS